MTTRADRVVDTRERIIRSAAELFVAQAYDDVTLAAIAKASGVSHQTVLNHFESKAGVVLAVAEATRDETVAARRAEPGDIGGAISALVAEYERMGDANFRWAAEADRIEAVAEILAGARRSHQAWLEELVGDRLPTGATARRRAVDALHAATDVYTWKLLRRDLGRSVRDTQQAMVDLVVGVLEGAKR